MPKIVQSGNSEGLSAKESRLAELEAARRISGKGTIGSNAIEAGYSPKNASVSASQALQKPKIQAAIQARIDRACIHAGITNDEIVGMIAEISRHSLADVPLPEVMADGKLDWTATKAANVDQLIKEVEITTRHSKDGSKRVTAKFKGYARDWALEQLKEIRGLHKQPGKNPIDAAREAYELAKGDDAFADVPPEKLREIYAQQFGVAASDLIQ